MTKTMIAYKYYVGIYSLIKILSYVTLNIYSTLVVQSGYNEKVHFI